MLSGDGNSKFWKNQPAVGPSGSRFRTWLVSAFGSLWRTKDWVFDGYRQYSKRGSFFAVRTIDRGNLLVVPPRQIKSIYSLPETILDVLVTANESIQTKWTVWDNEVDGKPFHMDVIRNQITHNLVLLTPPIATELSIAFEREWGTSTTEWKMIDPWSSALKIVAGAANAALCGTDLCRNGEFLERLGTHAMCMFAGSLLISSTPRAFRWISGYIIGWTSYYLFRRVLKICLPVVLERLVNTAALISDAGYHWTPPRDGLQWLIDEAYATCDPNQLDPERLAHRLVFLNDVSMHSTGYTAQHVILDLASQDPSLGYIEALREEAGKVLKEAGGTWTRQAVTKLKLVISSHGITVQQGNSALNIPKGTLLGIPVQAIHYDESLYPDSKTFNPFRFSQPSIVRDIIDASADNSKPVSGSGGETTQNSHVKSKSSVTIDDGFLSFGFGKHACPGRFFALNELKMFVATLVLNYDIEHLQETGPRTTPILWLNVPKLFNGPKVRVRRRIPVEAA
ncbi:hypothetical protein DL768_008191 [Monosporascus sp. mg162]|nr:hypothetical protein DL768_008191 [Monosporascus sp. mg162]